MKAPEDVNCVPCPTCHGRGFLEALVPFTHERLYFLCRRCDSWGWFYPGKAIPPEPDDVFVPPGRRTAP